MYVIKKMLFPVTVIMYVFMLISFPTTDVYAKIFIIINTSVDSENVTPQKIKEIYLGKRVSWDSDGSEIKFAFIKKSDIHKEFLDKYIGISEKYFVRHWRSLIFTGKGVPPKIFKTEKEIIDFVAENKGAIGYCSSNINNKNIRTILLSK